MDLKEFYEDKKFVHSRIFLVQVSTISVFLLLLVGLWNLQLLRSKYYVELAERNRIRSTPLVAPRGKVLDRNGQILVDKSRHFQRELGQWTDPEAFLKA
jgi:penicillin-binding protein 2